MGIEGSPTVTTVPGISAWFWGAVGMIGLVGASVCGAALVAWMVATNTTFQGPVPVVLGSLTALAFVAMFGGFRLGLRRLPLETAAGYTTVPYGAIELPEVDWRSGRIIRPAWAPHLTRLQRFRQRRTVRRLVD